MPEPQHLFNESHHVTVMSSCHGTSHQEDLAVTPLSTILAASDGGGNEPAVDAPARNRAAGGGLR